MAAQRSVNVPKEERAVSYSRSIVHAEIDKREKNALDPERWQHRLMEMFAIGLRSFPRK
jgi:hypothetical protein